VECKGYLDVTRGRGTTCIGKQPCPYEGCGNLRVCYWGWYERKEGSIPHPDGASGPIPIRRFRCSRCRRTFSWRPRFLVFGRRFAAVSYQRELKVWAQGGASRWSHAWHEAGQAATKALRRQLRRRASELAERFIAELSHLGGSELPPAEVPAERRIWRLTRTLARLQTPEKPRYSCHLLFLALARHPSGCLYSLASA
jgi:hypothetical protein